MVSKIKVDEIESSQAGGSIAYNSALKLKQYTTSQINALSGMADGEMVYDTTLSTIKIYNSGDTNWDTVDITGNFTATGGTTATSGGYKYYKFTGSGSITI